MKALAKIIRFGGLLGLILLAGIVVGVPRQQTQPSQEKAPEDYLPDGEGRDLIFQGCVQCHDLRNTVAQRKPVAAWRRTVNEMIWRGAPLTTDEAETITKYLAASFGPAQPKEKAAGRNSEPQPQDRKQKPR